ncbi:MAG: hypothetical protein JNK02_15505 [Planctomycetes bacterium]|nr:hypothetical protein [Planctomycetota bacterium]
MLLRAFLAASAALLTSPTTSFGADTAGAGWGADFVRPLSFQAAFASHDTLSNGNRVVFDGSLVWIEQDDGTVLATLGQVPFATFASFVEVDPTETFVVLGESSSGNLFRVPLTSPGGILVPFANLSSNYDLAYEPGGATAIVSAATCGSDCGNALYRLDLQTGVATLVAAVDGPSGPVAISALGDLYYATQSYVFPTPPGSVSIVRWSAAQLASGPFPLSQGQAVLFRGGLDGGSSLALDLGFGHLFVGDAAFGGTSRVIELDRQGALVGEVASSLDYLGKVELLDVPGAGTLSAFQPTGAQLQYRTTDFNQGTSQLVRVSPRRPQLSAVQNGDGTMTVSLTGGTPHTLGFVIVGPVALYSPIESAYDLGGYLLWTGLPFANLRRVGIQPPLDGNGAGSFTFQNPPPIQGTRVIQVLVRDAQGVFRGASTAVTN